MHGRHDHDDKHHAAPRPGHNRTKAPAQWQVPHLHEAGPQAAQLPERDLDLVESSFVEGFVRAADPTSFLRLAKIPFVGVDSAGKRLHLLRVETESLTDVGGISPILGGEAVRYDPLPGNLVSQRRRLHFVYHDGRASRRLDFAQARALNDESGATHFPLNPARDAS